MFRDKLKNFLINKENEPNKKKIENLVVFIIILIITIIVINVIWNGDKENNNTKSDSNKKLAETIQETNNSGEDTINNEDKLVMDLEEILSKINGVGTVKVMVTYAETSKTIPVYNEENSQESTEEKDSRWRDQNDYTNRQ